MPEPSLTPWFVAMVFGLSAATCGGQPKQAEAPDVTTDKGADMQAEPSSGDPGKVGGAEDAKASEAELHTKCCGECKEGMAKDRSGTPADKVPCADFTSTLKPWCLEHFRSKPTMAAQCN